MQREFYNVHFDDQGKQVVPLFASRCSLKENVFSVFLLSRNSHESFGEPARKSCGQILSAHSIRRRKMPGWRVLVRENFSVNKRVRKNKHLKFCLFSFSNFTFGFNSFHLKTVENRSIDF